MTEAVQIRLPTAILERDSYLVADLRGKLFRRIAEGSAALGLRVGHNTILVTIEDAGPLSQRDLATLLKVDTGDIVRIIDELERLGLVERRADPADRRRNVLAITAAGRAMRLRCDEVVRQAEHDILGALDPDERAVLHRLLRKLFDRGEPA